MLYIPCKKWKSPYLCMSNNFQSFVNTLQGRAGRAYQSHFPMQKLSFIWLHSTSGYWKPQMAQGASKTVSLHFYLKVIGTGGLKGLS